ncbi:MAG: GHMP kinase [Chlorobi bacterium]|nr:GHMP kinase [Chlorobiota bacterium]
MLIIQTPLRISLAGGGTDFPDYYQQYGGYVVSTAIDKYIYVIVNARYDDKIYVDYSRKEIVDHIDEIQHDLVREAARMTGMVPGFEVAMMADIPSEGSGLGSSSSLTVGLLNAFYHYQGKQVEREVLAQQACEIEIDILGRPIGRQDQYIAAYGGLCGIRFEGKDGVKQVSVERLDLDEHQKRRLGSNLLLFFTDIVRKSSAILDEQKKKIADTTEAHHGIKELALRTQRELLGGNYDALGDILHQNWELKRGLASGVTTDEIDLMYERARTSGAVGGKISGAGGGGFLLCYCQRGDQEELREALGDYREMPFMLEPFGSRVIFHQERYRW